MTKVDVVPYATRWDPELLRWVRTYASRQRLTVRVVLNAALAEYAARREQTNASPAPQLHYRRGHPPSSLVERQNILLQVDPRGRRVSNAGAVGRAHAIPRGILEAPSLEAGRRDLPRKSQETGYSFRGDEERRRCQAQPESPDPEFNSLGVNR